MASFDFHDFLLTQDGDLNEGAKEIPKLRKYIDAIPETKATFKFRNVEYTDRVDVDINPYALSSVHMEFLKSWPAPKSVAGDNVRGTCWVNPNCVHAGRFTDIIIPCKCGALIDKNYQTDARGEPQEHEDHCKPHWRLWARTQLAKRKHDDIIRLGHMGWRSNDIAPRFGIKDYDSVSPSKYGTPGFTDLHDEYRRLAGNTYAHLVYRKDYRYDEVAEIYGHSYNSLSRWVDKYSDLTRTHKTIHEFEEEGAKV